jgi:hypothetical protein
MVGKERNGVPRRTNPIRPCPREDPQSAKDAPQPTKTVLRPVGNIVLGTEDVG